MVIVRCVQARPEGPGQMPIFELDEGRPRLVQPMQPLAGSFAQEAAALLTHHLAAIAGEPLFAVRSRTTSPSRWTSIRWTWREPQRVTKTF